MNDPATLSARPRPMTVGGRTYMVHPLTLSDFGDLQSWVDSQFPDPVEVATRSIEAGDFNPAQQQFLLKTALEIACRGRHMIGSSDLAAEKLFSASGIKEVLFKAISKGDPSFTRKDADDLHSQMNMAHVLFLQATTTLDLVADDPKAGPAAGAEA